MSIKRAPYLPMFTFHLTPDRNIDSERMENTHQLQSAKELISFLLYLLRLRFEAKLAF